MAVPAEDGLRVVDETDAARPVGDEAAGGDSEAAADGRGPSVLDRPRDGDLEDLRDAFVSAFNDRDLDAVLALVDAAVDCPDIHGEGVGALAEELTSIWERSPGAVLTRALVDGVACAVGWLPDEDGCWSRAALVWFDADGSALTLVALPDDADALDRAEADEPTGEEFDEWLDWAEWEHGEESGARSRS